MNTNTAKTTTKSITVVDTLYWSNYNLLQNWQKPFTVEIYSNMNLSCLLLRAQLGRSIAK